MKKQGPNAKIFLALTVLTLVGGVAGLMLETQSLNASRMKVEELRLLKQDEVNVQQQLEDSKQKLEDSKIKLTHLESNIPTTAYIPTMLQELERMGIQEGIAVTGVRPMPTPAAKRSADGTEEIEVSKPYEEVTIEVKGRGTFDSVEKFLKSLQSFPKIVAARTVSMEPKIDPQNPMLQQLEVTIELKAFMFKQTPAKAKEAGA